MANNRLFSKIACAGAICILSMTTASALGSEKNAIPVYKDVTQSVDDRVADLLSRMTLDEKIGQLNQRSCSPDPGAVAWFADQIAEGSIGSLLNVASGADAQTLQTAAMQRSRLGIPIIIGRDVIHGYKTIFPIPLGQAASFDTTLVEQGARIAAIEASSDGVRWTFSPMIDIARDARWGRMAEGAGEDVFLTRMMGRAMVRGYQNHNTPSPTAIAACAKHFVGYGASESGRDYNSTYIPERLLRNVYLPSFEEACKAGCMTYMSSFNDNDGFPGTGNKFVVTDILRGEWGFGGFVVSDWASVGEMIPHGFASDRKDAALKAFTAGVDMEMESGTYTESLKTLLDEGKVTMSDIDKSVAAILRVKFMLGLFDDPYVSTPQSVKYCPDHLNAARRMAQESVIMLKNADATLPLGADVKRILVTGPMADAAYDQLGTWIFDGEKEHTVTVLQALKDAYGDKIVIDYVPALAYSRDRSTQAISNAVEAAKQADVIIAVVGEEAILSGEAHCLADLHLVGAQCQLISELAKTGTPLVTVVMAGRPLTIADEVESSKALLYAFHPGTMGGPALVDILFGKVSPSGKTPVSFPKMVGQVPIYYSHNSSGRPAQGTETLIDDIPINAAQTSLGNTSYWLDAGFGPLFPFGYGLTYGNFVYSDLRLDNNTIAADGVIRATVTLANTGEREATEVAQLYVRDLVGSVTRPVKELKDFRRVTLAPGASTDITFEVPASELAFFNADMQRVVEPGDFMLWIGGDSDCTLCVPFTVK